MAADIKNYISIFRSQKTSSNEWPEEKREKNLPKRNTKTNSYKNIFDYLCLNSHV